MIPEIFKIFPKPIQDYAMEVNQGLNFNLEYIFGSILFASSVSIGNSYQLKIKNGWNEGCNLFMIIVGPTGVAKTPTIAAAANPLIRKNQEYFNQWKKEQEEYEKNKMLSADERKNQLDDLKEPKKKQIIAEDATLEAIYRSHDNNPKGFGIYYDEVIGFFNNMGKYNKGSDQEQWLKIWSRKSITVDRVSSKPISIPLPHISLIGGIQTKLISELFKDNREKNGFVERLLFIMPDYLEKKDFPEHKIPTYVFEEYERILNRLADLPISSDEFNRVNPSTLEFTQEALTRYKSYYNKNSKLHREGNLPDEMLGFYPKMDTYCARFALILQLLYWACEEEPNDKVGLRAVEGAIILSDYFLSNAKKVLKKIKEPTVLKKEHKKLFAFDLIDHKDFSYRDAAHLLDVSHETVRQWTLNRNDT